MKKCLFSSFTLLLFVCNAVSYAQTDYLRITRFPTISQLCYDSILSETSNIPRFFEEWAEWSKLVSKGVSDSRYNEIFVRYFREYYGKEEDKRDCKYIALPERIKVIKYNCKIYPDSLMTGLPESISYFIPKIELERPVVYLTPEVTDILDSFIDAPVRDKNYESVSEDDWAERWKRMDMIREYIPAELAHWGDGWYYSSYPLFDTIYVGEDGYYVSLSDADYSGFRLFVTWSGEEQLVVRWFQ